MRKSFKIACAILTAIVLIAVTSIIIFVVVDAEDSSEVATGALPAKEVAALVIVDV